MSITVLARAYIATVLTLVIALLVANLGLALVPPGRTPLTSALHLGVIVVSLPIGVILADRIACRIGNSAHGTD